MAIVNLIDPYSQQAEEIARRKRMAQALQESGSQVLDMPTTPGVAISPYAGLAKILESGLGAYQEKKARDDYTKLQNEYRTNYNTQLENFARALSAPAVEGVKGQEFVADVPASTRSLGLGFGGDELTEEVAAIPGQAAVAPVEARPAGYISPETLKGFDIPEVKQLAMAKYLAQFEPKAPISVAAGGTLIDSRTFKPVFTAPAKDAKAAVRPIVLGEGQSAYDTSGKLLVTGPAKTIKAAEPKWEKGVKTVDGKSVYGWYDLAAPNYEASFKAGAVPPAGDTKLIEVTRGGKVYYENPAIVDTAARQAAAIEKEAVKTPAHYNEIEDKGNIVIVDMNLPANERLAKGQIKGPIRGNLKQIATNDAEGRPVTRWVEETTLAKLGDIPQQYTGLLLEMAQAGQLKPGWESDPRVAGVIRDNLINQSGGITPARLADIRVRIAEAAARLGDLGIAFDAKGLTPSLSNLTTLPSGSSAAATPAAAAIAKAPPKINDVVINGDKKFKFKGGDPNQQSNWVEVK